jgi:hypothetical protein
MADFHIVAFSLAFENDYTNLVHLLQLGKLSLYSSRRDDDLEIPTFLRRNRKSEDGRRELSRPMSYKDLPIDEDELEIPTFLRRQAD